MMTTHRHPAGKTEPKVRLAERNCTHAILSDYAGANRSYADYN